MSSNLDNHKSSVRDIAQLFAKEKRLGTKAADLVNGTALTKCLEINEAFEVLGTPAEQRVAILASTVFCAETPHGVVVKQAISAAIRKQKETIPLPEIPPPNIPPKVPTPDQLALINYHNQLQRDSNKVAMRQYYNKMYKAMLRFIVSQWVPYSAAMRLLGRKGVAAGQATFTRNASTGSWPCAPTPNTPHTGLNTWNEHVRTAHGAAQKIKGTRMESKRYLGALGQILAKDLGENAPPHPRNAKAHLPMLNKL